MSNRHWMPLDIGAYLKDTGHLTVAEHGAYLLLIMRYWEDGGLPSDERLIARYSHMSPDQWAESRDILAAFFDEGWKHGRIDAEIAKAEELIGKRRDAANQRHSKSNAHAEQVQSNSSDTGVPHSHKPSSTLRSDDSAPARPTPRQRLEAVLDSDHAEAVLEHRQRLRKPLTERAAKLMAADLAKFPDPNAAADRMIGKGWLTIDASWQDPQPRGSPPGKPRSVLDAVNALNTRMEQASADSAEAIEGTGATVFRLPAAQQR